MYYFQRRNQKRHFPATYVNKKTAQPEILTSKDERFGDVVRYMEDVTKNQGLDTKYNISGDEVVLLSFA